MERKGVGAAGVGPRVIGRLTPELISRSPQYMSCVDQYELDLRGCRIATIENLGATEVSNLKHRSFYQEPLRCAFPCCRPCTSSPHSLPIASLLLSAEPI